MCTYICLKPGYALVNEAGYRIRNQLFCRCNGLDCEWDGQAYDGKCRDYDEYRLNIQKEVNHVVMKKYFKAVAVPVNLKIAKFAGGANSKRVKKKVKKLKRLGKAIKLLSDGAVVWDFWVFWIAGATWTTRSTDALDLG